MPATRIHLIAHANPLGPDAKRFGFASVDEYLAFLQEALPRPYRATFNRKLLHAVEVPWGCGRPDDTQRIRDIQRALDDANTAAIVALSGGAYFSRILPHLDFSPLQQRRTPLHALGFSEMTTFVNLVSSYRGGRGWYWLGPNWLGYRVRPLRDAREALAEYFASLPDLLVLRTPPDAQHLHFESIAGEVAQGRLASGRVRLVGGCLAVLAAILGAPFARRLRPRNKWVILEDLKESPYRIDRHLAALKLAGWFDEAAGVLVGDFHMMNRDTQKSVLDLLRFHLPRDRRVPLVTTKSFGHVWPIVPVLLNRPLQMTVRGRTVTIASPLRG